MSKKKVTPSDPDWIPTPNSNEQCNEYIAKLAGLQDQIRSIEALRDEVCASAKTLAEETLQPLQKRLAETFAAIEAYATANRDLLTNEGKTKTVRMPAGTLSWRDRPASVKLKSKWSWDKLVAHVLTLSEMMQTTFLRTKHEIDKNAVLAAAPDLVKDLKGVKVESAGEDFSVDPYRPEKP